MRNITAVRALASSATNAQAPPTFDGEVAKLYAKVFEQMSPIWERHVEAVKRHAGAPPERVLDIASGPGQPAAMLAQEFKKAEVMSTDFAPDMVAQASERMQKLGLKNVTCEILDMQAMKNVASDSMDVCTVSFGYMFAPQLGKALSETHRVLRPGGIMTASVWLEFPVVPLAGRIMTDVLGHRPPPPPINPMSLSEREAFDVPLATAGLRIIGDEEGQIRFNFGSDPKVAWKLGCMPVLPKLLELRDAGTHGDVLAKARSAFERETAGWTDPSTKEVVTPEAKYRLVVTRKE